MRAWFPYSGKKWIVKNQESVHVSIDGEDVAVETMYLYYFFNRDTGLAYVDSYNMGLFLNGEVVLEDSVVITQYLPDSMEEEVLEDLGVDFRQENKSKTKPKIKVIDIILIGFVVVYIVSFLVLRKIIEGFNFLYLLVFIFAHFITLIFFLIGAFVVINGIRLTFGVVRVLQSVYTVGFILVLINSLHTFMIFIMKPNIKIKKVGDLTAASTIVFLINYVLFIVIINVFG